MRRLDASPGFSGLLGATKRLARFSKPHLEGTVGAASEGIRDIQLALQQIIIDLYDGFLSKEDRTKIGVEGLHIVRRPPRVELDSAPESPFPHYEPEAHTVRLAAWLAQPGGILTWVSLAHESSGHAVLMAYGLEEQLRKGVGDRLHAPWTDWFEEAASDCLGVLNLGPAMVLGSIVSWRAYELLTNGTALLPCGALEGDPRHPPPVLRAYLMAHLTGRLGFTGADSYSKALKQAIQVDLHRCHFSKQQLEAAEIFVELLVERKQAALKGSRFLDLQNWQDGDQDIADELQRVLRQKQSPVQFAPKHYATHALAAAITQIVTAGPSERDQDRLLRNLVSLLLLMYRSRRGQNARAELHLGDPASVDPERTLEGAHFY